MQPDPGPGSNPQPSCPRGLPALSQPTSSPEARPGTPAPCPSRKGSPQRPAQLYTLRPCLCFLTATLLLFILQFPKVPGASHLTVTASVPVTLQKAGVGGGEQCQPLPRGYRHLALPVTLFTHLVPGSTSNASLYPLPPGLSGSLRNHPAPARTGLTCPSRGAPVCPRGISGKRPGLRLRTAWGPDSFRSFEGPRKAKPFSWSSSLPSPLPHTPCTCSLWALSCRAVGVLAGSSA